MSADYRRCLLISSAILCGSFSGFTTAGESITSAVVWQRADSPVRVDSTITVVRGARLTIEPGVVVQFAADAGLVVEGELVAVGAKGDSIHFTALSGDTPGSWGGILFVGSPEKVAYGPDGSYTGAGSVIDYGIIEFAGSAGFEGNAAIAVMGSSPLIVNSAVRRSRGGTGVIRCGNLSSPAIINCEITHNGAERGGGVSVGFGARSLIKRCLFFANEASDNGGAVYLSHAAAEISGNGFIDNRAGGHGGAIYAAIADPLDIVNNSFYGNSSAFGSPVLFFTDRVAGTIRDNIFQTAGVSVYLQKATDEISLVDNWWGDPRGLSFKNLIRDRAVDNLEPPAPALPPLPAPPIGMMKGYPTAVDKITLCRDDSFVDEIPYGVAEGAPLRIRLDGRDANPGHRDWTVVRVTSRFDSEGILVPLMETEVSSGVFTGRGTVASASDQAAYAIGDRTGGRVTLTAPFAPTVKAEYPTLSPNPIAEDFTIADVQDLSHLTDHHPTFVWSYFEVLELPQQTWRLTVTEITPDGESGRVMWRTGDVAGGHTSVGYDGETLADGQRYRAELSVYDGRLWNEPPATVEFRMNSLPAAPQLISPADNAIIASVRPLLQVTEAADPEGDSLAYIFELAPLSPSEAPFVSAPIRPSAGRVVWPVDRDLIENAGYRFRVRADDSFEAGIWSDYRTLWVNAGEEPPGRFELTQPIGGAAEYDLHPTLSWQAAIDPDPSSTVIYEVTIGKSAEFAGARRYSDIRENYFTVPDSLQNRTEYYWKVTAVDNTQRTAASSGEGRFRVDTTPTAPILISPLEGAEVKPGDALIWQASTDPDPNDILTYEVMLSGYQSEVLTTTRVGSAVSITVNRLVDWELMVDNREYMFRVRARDNHNAESDWSAIGVFFFNKINDAPSSVPAILAPGDTVAGSNQVTFRWQAAADPDRSDPPDVLRYEIEATQTDFNADDVRSFTTAPGALTYTAALDDNRMWKYRVRAVDDEGAFSQWSAARRTLVNAAEDPPASFALFEPSDGALVVELDSVMFNWEPSSDPDWESSIAYIFTLTPENGESVTVNNVKPGFWYKRSLKNEANYRWSIRAVDNTGLTTPCRGEFTFRTSTTPTAPAAGWIADELTLADALPFSGADDPNPADELNYTLEIAADESFRETAVTAGGITHRDGNIRITLGELPGQEKLLDDRDYFARLRARDNHGYDGPWSSLVRFRFNRQNDAPTAPTAPFEPTADAVMLSRNPQLSWGVASDEDLTDPAERLFYDVRLGLAPELERESRFTFETPAGVTSFVVPAPLDDNLPWYWQVRARDDDGAVSPWSPVIRFLINVSEDPPSTPALIAPYNGQQFNHLGPIQLRWSPSVDPDWQSNVTYYVEYGLSPDFSGAFKSAQLDSSVMVVTGPLENSTYYWRCTAVDNTGLTAMSQAGSFTLDTRPSVPQPIAPVGGAELKPDDSFRWTPARDPNPQDIVTYSLASGLGAGPDQSSLTFTQSGIASTSASLSEGGFDVARALELGDNLPGWWRVKATDNNGIASSWSQVGTFVFNGRNDPPATTTSLLQPAAGDIVAAPVLVWQEASDPDPSDLPDRLSYLVELSQDAQFKDKVLSQKSPPGQTSLQPVGLEDNRIWFWRVLTVDGQGARSEPSAVSSFIYNARNDPPGGFDLLSPAPNAVLNADGITFSWTAAVDPDPADDLKYVLHIAKDAMFSIEHRSFETVDTRIIPPDSTFTSSGVYFWKVAAMDKAGAITFGARSDSSPRAITVRLPEPKPAAAPSGPGQ